MQERKHIRFAVQRPVTFRGDFVSGSGTILNISRQGCAIVSDTVAEADAYLQLDVQLLEDEDPSRPSANRTTEAPGPRW